jgi:hypothetical protein
MDFMFEQYNEIFNRVIELARKRREYNENYGLHSGSLEDFEKFDETEEGKQLQQYDKEIVDYLEKLDFEVIKIIQTLMYLGRDDEYPNLIPEQRYKKERQYFDKKGWQTKSIEIGQICEKMPLDKYLKSGLDILQK